MRVQSHSEGLIRLSDELKQYEDERKFAVEWVTAERHLLKLRVLKCRVDLSEVNNAIARQHETIMNHDRVLEQRASDERNLIVRKG